ncbi:MAG: winged helix-turn-helix domain-containing protein [Cyanobacteria bacterium REEB67]|nr:winged helix-turn-helix domain-containing protein [Cyanobacteria bacterium REEB67]
MEKTLAGKGPNTSKQLSREALELVAQRFRLLGEASRLELVQALCLGEKTGQQLCELTGMGQANVSKHLSVLCEHGILSRRKEGSFVYYVTSDDSIKDLCDIVCSSLAKRIDAVQKALQNIE